MDRRGACSVSERSQFVDVVKQLVGLDFDVDDIFALGKGKGRQLRKRYELLRFFSRGEGLG